MKRFIKFESHRRNTFSDNMSLGVSFSYMTNYPYDYNDYDDDYSDNYRFLISFDLIFMSAYIWISRRKSSSKE